MDVIQFSLSLTLNWHLFTGTWSVLASCSYVLRDHPFTVYVKFSEKQTFLTTCVYQYYVYMYVKINKNSKLTKKTPRVFIVNFEHILHLVLVFLLLTLNM